MQIGSTKTESSRWNVLFSDFCWLVPRNTCIYKIYSATFVYFFHEISIKRTECQQNMIMNSNLYTFFEIDLALHANTWTYRCNIYSFSSRSSTTTQYIILRDVSLPNTTNLFTCVRILLFNASFQVVRQINVYLHRYTSPSPHHP